MATKTMERTTKRWTVKLMDNSPVPLDKLAAWIILAIMFIKVPGVTLVPIGAALLLPLTPMLYKTMERTIPTRRIAIAAAVAITVGLIARFISASGESSPSSNTMLLLILIWVAAFPVMLLGAIWAFERVDIIRGSAVMFAVCALSAFRLEQSWKGSFGITLTLFLLAFLARRRMFWTRLVLVAVTVLNGAGDARTTAAISFIAFLCTFLTQRQMGWIGKHPKRAVLLIIASFAALSYALVAAMESGLLGESIQQRTLDQTTSGRDLITAGRAEWAATFDLFTKSPFGFGTGVTPDPGLQTEAVNAVHQVGGDYLAPYWVTNVFPERTDLHSTTANLWVHYSLGGVLLALTLGAVLLGAIPLALSVMRSLGAMPLFAVLNAAWDLLFSPMADSDRLIMGLIAAVVLLRLRESEQWPLTDIHLRKPKPELKSKTPRPVHNKYRESYLAGR